MIRTIRRFFAAALCFTLASAFTLQAQTTRPVIVEQPQTHSVISGEYTSFVVVATGTEPLLYQWRKNAINIAAATNSVFSISNAQPASAGVYNVLVRNSAGSVTSSNAVLKVLVIGRITIQPINKTVVAGGIATFSVAATGTAPLDYQWQKDGNDLPGATRATLTITNAQPANAGIYRVIVHNAAGSVISSNAALTVYVRPVITSQPQAFSVIAGSAATFTVEASGTAPLRFQWRKNGINIAGATNSSFTIAVTQASSTGNYSVLVSNAAGSVASANALFTVLIPPHITTSPVSKSLNAGGTATFTVVATGTARLQYVWFKDDQEIAGATNATLSIPNAQLVNAGRYRVTVSNAVGSDMSSVATLTVNVRPVFTLQPQSQTVIVGQNVSFIVYGSATEPARFQWRKNGVNIAGATNQQYTITNVQLSHAGNYSVVVSNPAGTAVSATAVLTVNPAPNPNAISFSVSPADILNTYSGAVQFNITGLNNGETVRIEEFLDRNDNSSIDTADMLVQSIEVTDGQVFSIGGVRDINVPGDEDQSVNGQILARVSFPDSVEFARGAGRHLIRVSSPSGRFDPVVHTLTVSQPALSQRVTGRVLSAGAAVPFAFTALLVKRGSDGLDFVSGGSTDASGNYSLTCTSGTYVVFAVKNGFVFNQNTAPSVTVNPGQTVNTNLSLTAAGRTLSGRATDAATGAGIAGLQIFLQSSNNWITLAFSGTNGNYSAMVSQGFWETDVSENGVARLGYLRPGNHTTVTVGSVDVSNVNFLLSKETALIYGNVRTSLDVPLPNIRLSANSQQQFDGRASTDANGNYSLGVVAGNWYVGLNNNNSGLVGYGISSTNVTVVAGQAAQINFIARPFTAHLIGRVVDANGAGISGIGIGASPDSGGGSINFITTGSDGSFDVGVFAGTWSLQLESSAAASRGLISPYMTFTVADGSTVSGINFVALSSTARINGTVKTASNAPFSNLNVWANATINNLNYNSNASTDASGNFSLPAVNGTWNVGVDCYDLQGRGFSCPQSQIVTVNGGNASVTIIVSP